MTDNLLEIFRKSYRNLELAPLKTEEDFSNFALPCNPNLIAKLEQLIEDGNPTDNKIIFSGHRGCGKSTLLAQLKHNLEDRFFVVFFSISDMIEMSDVNHINILFAIAVSLMEEAENKNIKIAPSDKEEFYGWFATKTSTEINEFKVEGEVGFNFTNLLAWIKGVLKTNATVREEIKQEYQRNVSSLVQQINKIATVIKEEHEEGKEKEILVIIDDIDKLDLKQVNDIFLGNIKALFSVNFRLLMTIPIAALREINLYSVLVSETNNQIIRMPVYKLLPKGVNRQENVLPNQANIELLKNILKKRINLNIIEENILTEIVIYSGGVLRELIRIANGCCRICLILIRSNKDNNSIKINQEILQDAINELSLDFEAIIGKDDYQILTTVYQYNQPSDPQCSQFLALLHALYILEYRNSELWYDLHPIISKLLKKKKIVPD